jgi:hypothetical protein
LVDPANGETDLDGEPRVIYSYGSCAGPAPAVTDIGAYQYLSPVTPVPACIHRRRPDTRITFAKVTRRKHTARFRFRAIGAASGFECELIRRSGRHRKKPGFRRCASPKLYRHLKPGRYVFRVRAIEGRLGRLTDPTPAKRKFRI